MNIAAIFAGGSGRRMGASDIPKQFLQMHDKPIIIHTLEHFQNHPEIDAIVIACKEDWISHLQQLVKQYHTDKVKSIVPGGDTGQESIYHALLAAKIVSGGEQSTVLIHDGVRPMIDADVISRDIRSVNEHGSAITTSVVSETILVVNENESIQEVPDRGCSRIAKAPQCFWLDDILACHERARAEGRLDFIDSCTMMKTYGHELYLVDGPQDNIKITTQEDFYTIRALLDVKEDLQFFCKEARKEESFNESRE